VQVLFQWNDLKSLKRFSLQSGNPIRNCFGFTLLCSFIICKGTKIVLRWVVFLSSNNWFNIKVEAKYSHSLFLLVVKRY